MSIQTAIIGIAILSSLMSLAVLGSLFQARIPGVRQWSGASALVVVTSALLLSGRSDSVVVGASVLLLVAALLALQGFRLFFDLRAAVVGEYIAFGVIVAALLYWTYIAPHVNAREAMMSGFLAYIRASIAAIVLRNRPTGRPKYSYYFVAGASLLGAVVHLFRCITYGFGLAHETTFLQATPLNIAFLGIATLTLPCLAVGMVMLAHDRLAQRMERLATIDDLTGVLGRRAFIARAEALANIAKATQSKLSIAILDIDNFKSVNDRYGHAAGDQALAHVASAIAHELRHGDVLGRIGGEEFALVLPMTGKEEAARITNRLRVVVETSVVHAPVGEVFCTLSAGVDEFASGDTLAAVMARADTALYAAKGNGRNCVMMAGAAPVRWDKAVQATALNHS